jgi:hypothetical protein
MSGHDKGGSSRHGNPDLPTTTQPDRVTRLKEQVALGRYRVDPDAVAREILFKRRLLSRSRRALLAGSGGGRRAAPSPHEQGSVQGRS